MSFWVIRIFFLLLCVLGGVAISQVREELISNWYLGALIGFGFGGLLIAIEEMLKGFSLRAFSAATFGLALGSFIAWMVDRSGLFQYADEMPVRWLIRLCTFLFFGYLGMVLAMRSNKDDFSLIIPFVRFQPTSQPNSLLLLDTSAIVDGRIVELIERRFVEGTVVVPRFVLHEVQQIADSADPVKRARGRRGLDILNRIRRLPGVDLKIHDTEYREENAVDSKLVRLAKVLQARLCTTDYNLSKIAELQGVHCLNIAELASVLKPVVLPGDTLNLKIVREGRDKGQGVGYLPDGTMVVVNQGQPFIGQQATVLVQSLLQTGAGIIIFAEIKNHA